MYTLIQSTTFASWFAGLRDAKLKQRVNARMTMAERGNFGDSAPVGEGVSEMRIHLGSGYRIYYVRTGATVVLLLTAGDKATQDKDIRRAKAMAREFASGGNDDGS